MARVRNRELTFLALSLGLHLIALGAFGPSPRPILIEPTHAPLQWVDLAPVVETRPPPARLRRVAPSPPRAQNVVPAEPVPRTPEPDEKPAAEVLISVPAQSRPSELPLAEIMASARAIGRETARAETWPSQDPGAVEDRPILPQLDRALRRAAASERRLSNGLIRIVTAGGRVYCLQEPPDFARGGPAEMLAVPTNCP